MKCAVLICVCCLLYGSEPSDVIRPPSVQTELVLLALPAIAGQAIEPLAQLMETAYIGRLGNSNWLLSM